MALLQLHIQTPHETTVYSDLLEISLPGADGIVGILPNHASIIVGLKEGMMGFLKRNGHTRVHYFIHAGVAHITNNTCLVLVEKYSQA
jgi:F-type H+-transporting ATPase subunit epsilon